MEIITGKLDHVRPRNDEVPVKLVRQSDSILLRLNCRQDLLITIEKKK